MPYFKRENKNGKVIEFGETVRIPEGAKEITKEEFESLRRAHIRPEARSRAYQLISFLEVDIRRERDLFRRFLRVRAPVLIEELLSSIDWDTFLRDHQDDLSRFIASLDPQLFNALLTIILSQSRMIQLLYSAIEELQGEVQKLDPSWKPNFKIRA